MEGSPGLALTDVAHVAILGRGRDASGMGLNDISASRVVHGAEFWAAHDLNQNEGSFISTGYKSPNDQTGELWSPNPNAKDPIWLQGIPEADSMDMVVGALAPVLRQDYGTSVAPERRRIDRASIDTVTNLAQMEAQQLYGTGDERPVVFVAQAEHLDRTLEEIAPKVARRDYIGLVVPEIENHHDTDSALAAFVSKAILLGISNMQTPEAVLAKTDWRARQIWKLVLTLKRLAGKEDQPYITPNPA